METMSRSPKAKTRIQFSKNLFFFGHFSFVGTATKSILWLSLVAKFIQASGLSLCSTNHRLTIRVIMGHIKRPTREWQGKPVDQQDSVSLTQFWTNHSLRGVHLKFWIIYSTWSCSNNFHVIKLLYANTSISKYPSMSMFLFSPSALLNQPAKKEFPLI